MRNSDVTKEGKAKKRFTMLWFIVSVLIALFGGS